MAGSTMLWILFGLFVQYQLIAADKPTDKVSHDIEDAGDKLKADIIQSEVPTFDESIEPQFGGDDSDVADMEDDKRGYGKWRNLKWSQKEGKRNFGRWQNRKWQEMKTYGPLNDDNSYGHSLNKRFSDSGADSADDFAGLNGYELPSGDMIVNGPYGYIDGYEGGQDLDGLSSDQISKRHMSRWNLIHRKLSQLNSQQKRDSVLPSADKRMIGRWRLIHNKLNELHGRQSKRFAGRWRNQNWLLKQAFEKSEIPDTQNGAYDFKYL